MDQYQGLVIRAHCIKNKKSKEDAIRKLTGWERVVQSSEEWMQELEQGRTIILADMEASDTGAYTHAEKYWKSTYFVMCDADNIKGVDFDTHGVDENPDGVEPWTDKGGLSELYPNLKDRVYAVAESVSSMADWKETPHRRYRLIFRFDTPITNGDHYRQVLLALADEFAIIPKVERQPAQPVFGNARDGFSTVHICGNTLKLSDYQQNTPEAFTEQPTKASGTEYQKKTLRDWLGEWGIDHEAASDVSEKYFVRCPYSEHHTEGKCNPKDAYVFVNESGKFAFHCSHASCKSAGRTTWDSFKLGYGIRKGEGGKYKISKSEPPEPKRLPAEDLEDIKFPVEALEGTIFGYYERAYAGRNETCPAFRFAELAFVFGCLAGRRISLKSGIRPIYPNMYVSLVGRSNFSHKGESLHKIRQLISDYEMETLKVASFLPTAEGLIGMLSEVEDTRLVCLLDEFKALFSKASQKTSESLIPRLNEAYDCPPKLDNHTKIDPLVAIRPNVNLIGCLTPKWFEDSATLSNIGGGFMNRFAFFMHEQMPLKSLSEVQPPRVEELGIVKRLIKAVAELNTFKKYEFSDEVKEHETEWYHTTMSQLLEKDDVIVDATARVNLHVIKIALILAFMNDNEANIENKINLKEWTAARAVGEYLAKVNIRLFGELSFDRYTAQEQRVLKALDRCGGTATKTELSNRIGRNKASGVSARDLARIIEALAANEVIMITALEPHGCKITRIN